MIHPCSTDVIISIVHHKELCSYLVIYIGNIFFTYISWKLLKMTSLYNNVLHFRNHVVFSDNPWDIWYFTYLFSDLENVMFLMFTGLEWSMDIAIIIYIRSNTGYGGVANSFISWPGWEPRTQQVKLWCHFNHMKYFTH